MSQMSEAPYESEYEVRVTRVFDAPVAAVWDAWADDAQVVQWWGPRGFTVTTHERALRAGGAWSYTMHGPDGKDWPNFARYIEVEPHARLVYEQGATPDGAKPLFRVTATFRALGDRTAFDMRMTFDTAEAATQTRAFVQAVGGNTTWDRLAEYLVARTTGAPVFVIARSFAVDRTTLFAYWTQPAHFARWLPPTGMDMTFHRIDIRSGGEGFYSMGNDAFTMYGRLAYHRIEEPSLLEYTQCFTDAHGQLARHPMAPLWPAYMHSTVHLAEEGPSRTRVTVQWQPDASATPEEIAAFTDARAGMTMGWTGSFDKLDALIAELNT